MKTTAFPRPMGIGDLLDEAIRLFRTNFGPFIAISAVVQVPFALFQIVVSGWYAASINSAWLEAIDPGNDLRWTANLASPMLASGLFLIPYMIGYLVMQAALTWGISQRYLGRPLHVGGAYRVALRAFWRLIGTIIVVAIGVFLYWLAIPIAVGLAVTAFVAIAGLPTFLPTVVIVIAGLFFTWLAALKVVRWSLFGQTIVLERAGVRQGLRRSSILVKGSTWRVFAVWLLAATLQGLLTAPAAIVTYVFQFIALQIDPRWLVFATTSGQVLSSLLGLVVAPFMPIVIILLYYDLRVRKEGFDLQLLASRIEEQSAPGAPSPR